MENHVYLRIKMLSYLKYLSINNILVFGVSDSDIVMKF